MVAYCGNQAGMLRARFEVSKRGVESWSSANDTNVNVTARQTGGE